ncbi:DNA sulfur modification protein DndD [Leucothrix sargassi]|nr:DNA sulfur modification protein DndD [Leucothrix sargassi]
MILESLSLNNFRVFQGQHDIALAPREPINEKKPIILFGGLNGAGKTSILGAIRLALFGRQSLGHSVTQKQYDGFLASCIHNTEDELLQSFTSSVALRFNYATQGIVKQYTVKRAWMYKQNNTVDESLIIEENGIEMSGLSKDQCQGFLNEIIPIGVADLFFFDGEKIAELAEDTQGVILGDAIKKLLGLDLLETLHGDLGVVVRNKSKSAMPAKLKKEISELESEFSELESAYKQAHSDYEQMVPVISSVDFEISQLNAELLSKGGAWAATREDETTRLATVNADIAATENQLRELLASNYPLSIAADYAQQVLKQLKSEQRAKRYDGTAALVDEHVANLRQTLSKLLDTTSLQKVNDEIQKEFSSLTNEQGDVELVHDISDSALATIEQSILDAKTDKKQQIDKLKKQLTKLREENEIASSNIARAPVEAVIKPILSEIQMKESGKQAAIKRQAKYLEQYKAALRDAMSVSRKLDKLSSESRVTGDEGRSLGYAEKTRSLLKSFSSEVAKQKVKQLEAAFSESFGRLTRKGDMSLKAKINPVDFSVSLVSANDREINKNELSAGEKQIYAISILESLAKTSGRNLPIIIDTPLGRLDSVHRTHLVNQYFPNASHQVIILSTDTEVDEQFYDDISGYISHAYRLEYSPEKGCTEPVEGYFWNDKKKEANHVA